MLLAWQHIARYAAIMGLRRSQALRNDTGGGRWLRVTNSGAVPIWPACVSEVTEVLVAGLAWHNSSFLFG